MCILGPFYHGDGGIRTLVPELTNKRISSAPRYDHFDTSPNIAILTYFPYEYKKNDRKQGA